MVKAELDWNESLYMSGGCHNLGDWSVDRAVPLEWTVGDVWMSEVWLPNDNRLETKLFLKNDIDGEVTWSPFENMHLYHDITVCLICEMTRRAERWRACADQWERTGGVVQARNVQRPIC